MPVHRPAKRKRTAVLGFPRDLDAWLARNRSHLESSESFEVPDSTIDIAALNETLARIQMEAAQLALALERAREEVRQFPQTSSTNLAAFTGRPS